MKLNEKILEGFGLERDQEGRFVAEGCRVTFRLEGSAAFVVVSFGNGGNIEMTLDEGVEPAAPKSEPLH